MEKIAIIIGAGPAGLTAAYELVTKTDIKPIILEKTTDIGGISKTVVYNGNRMDIGGHRFFSKSDLVMKWWQNIMPIEEGENITLRDDASVNTKNNKNNLFLLIGKRLSRIFFLQKFFDYPITLSLNTLKNLGFIRIIKIGFSYFWVKITPKREEKSLEDFFINRFGKELYKTFFRDYTEKVWGVPCSKIQADWGAQRVKDLSVSKTIIHAVKSIFSKDSSIEQKNVNTSLIDKFLYPRLGPGSMWERVADIIKEKGGEIIFNCDAKKITQENGKISEVFYQTNSQKELVCLKGDYFFSTMPVIDLVNAFTNPIPEDVLRVGNGLQYRDFMTVGLLLNKLKIKNETNIKTLNNIVPDNWIYIQEKEVKIGRLQIFNNWSPYMVEDPNKVWIGLEYFCYENDELWSMKDEDFIQFAIEELDSINIIEKEDVLDSTLVRMPKAYPAYFGTYSQFDVIRNYMDGIENLFLIGRNGMHKYNNADHSMLTAIEAVNNIINEIKGKDNVWKVNTEKEYHEEK